MPDTNSRTHTNDTKELNARYQHTNTHERHENMRDIIYKELSYRVNGIAFKVKDELGRFCRERQYADLFEGKLRQAGIKYKREVLLDKITKSNVKGNRVDFIIEDQIIVDLKAKKFITKDDYNQMQRYLECANLKLGLVINFRDSYLKPKRIINNKYDQRNNCS